MTLTTPPVTEILQVEQVPRAQRTTKEREKARDAALAAELRDTLRHDRRTAHLDLQVGVGYRMARVGGEVASEEERSLLRRLLRRQNGLLTVWDFLSLPGQQLEILDIGCGGNKQVPGAVGIDQYPAPGVDIVANLEEELPLEDDRFDHVLAVHCLEHIHDLVSLMREIHRVLRPTGVLHVVTPHWQHVNTAADPTHCRLMDVQTFKYFCIPHGGVLPWRPLMVGSSNDTVHADLQPIKDGSWAGKEEIDRWFV